MAQTDGTEAGLLALRRSLRSDTLDSMLGHIAEQAVENIPGCEATSITVYEGGRLGTAYASHAIARRLNKTQYAAASGPCVEAALTGTVRRAVDLAADRRWSELSVSARRAGIASVMSLPLSVDGERLGALNLYAGRPGAFDDRAAAVAEVFVHPAALALGNARAFAQALSEVTVLQRSLLPSGLPAISGVDMASRYVPAGSGTNIGGDWYDAVAVDDRMLTVSIGDVAGHGPAAATVMGQLRVALRAYTIAGCTPDQALPLMARFVSEAGLQVMATLCHATVAIDPTGVAATAQWGSAGHLPPLLRQPDGTCRFLEGPVAPPLGLAPSHGYPTSSVDVEGGSMLLLYTDGLVERRGEILDVGLGRLAEHFCGAAGGPEEVCDQILDAMAPGPLPDNVAMLAVQLRDSEPPTPAG